MIQLGAAPLQFQKRCRLRQVAKHERHRQHRQHRDVEHRLPAPLGDHRNRQQGREHRPHRVYAGHQSNHGAASTLGGEFADQVDGTGHQRAKGQPGHQPAGTKLYRCARVPGHEGRQAGHQRGDNNQLASTEAIRQWRKQGAAKEHAEQRAATQRAGFQRTQLPLLHQARHHRAVDHHVIAIEQHDETAPQQNQQMGAIEGCSVDHFTDGSRVHSHLYFLLLCWRGLAPPLRLRARWCVLAPQSARADYPPTPH
ncbi:hypothetical protein D3C72_1254480 [compost metagenome]